MPDDHMESSHLSGHDKGKLSRKRAILDAAIEIIRQQGEDALTMRDLALKAGVSPTTPYNLFGSKQAVLSAILEEDRQAFDQYFVDNASAKALPRLFDLIDLTWGYWGSEPAFFKPLLTILHKNSGSPIGTEAWSPRQNSVVQLVQQAVDAGSLVPETPTQLIADTLIRSFKAVGQEWVENSLSLEDGRKQIGASFVLLLTSLTPRSHKAELKRIRLRYD